MKAAFLFLAFRFLRRAFTNCVKRRASGFIAKSFGCESRPWKFIWKACLLISWGGAVGGDGDEVCFSGWRHALRLCVFLRGSNLHGSWIMVFSTVDSSCFHGALTSQRLWRFSLTLLLRISFDFVVLSWECAARVGKYQWTILQTNEIDLMSLSCKLTFYPRGPSSFLI